MGLIKKVGTKAFSVPSAESVSGSPPEEGTRTFAGGAAADESAPAIRPEGSADAGASTGARHTGAPGAPRSPTAMPLLSAGTVLQGRYQIEEAIGIGGMSLVYRGRDLRFKDVVRYCAIKEMAQSAPDSHTRLLNLKNFEREAGLLATLQHPAIPRVYDFFEENGRVYLVMELVKGKDMETILEEAGKPLDEARVGRWAVQICDVLAYLHNHKPQPIVFRDMKPSNIMVIEDDRIVLIDFGIARTLNRSDRKGTMIGTEGYSPPEQYRGIAEPVGDIYALGATLHHLLTNTDPRLETPFTFHERPVRQLNPAVSPEMEAVIVKAIEYDMEARWQSAEELKRALLAVPGIGETPVAPRAAAPAVIKGAASTSLVWSFACEDEVRSSPALPGACSLLVRMTTISTPWTPGAASSAGSMPPRRASVPPRQSGRITSLWVPKMARSTAAICAAVACAGPSVPRSRCAPRRASRTGWCLSAPMTSTSTPLMGCGAR
jgi:tRNA A-37 threonylcarbamoyl transferase component Bud32